MTGRQADKLCIDEVIDLLLDQEGFECDPLTTREGDTPLHCAARYINTLPPSPETSEWASSFLSLMTDAGSDATLKNKASLSPAQLLDPRLPDLKKQLEEAAESQQEVVVDKGLSKHELAALQREQAEEEGDEGGSGSDSDFDPEEYKREKERRKAEGGFI